MIKKQEKKNLENAIKQFEKERLKEVEDIIGSAEQLRTRFVADYPIGKILMLTLNEYMTAPKGCGMDQTFCKRLEIELKNHASMGNVWPDTFGVYLKGGTTVSLHKTLQKEFGDDINTAFEYIKTEIVSLLYSGATGDYDAIVNNKLNNSFKYKLLTVYYPEKYVPVCTKDTLQGYCKCIGLSVDKNMEMIYKNIELTKIKKSYTHFQNWSNALFMFFCDWLLREQKKIELKVSDEVIAIEIDKQIDKVPVEGKDKMAYIKSRVNQGIFRDKLLERYDECCMCKIRDPHLLVASHIKPWAACEPKEKLDDDNGLLLCPNHDALFDKGYITFDDNGYVIVSDQLNQTDKKCMNLEDIKLLYLTEGNKKYLEYHRTNIFLNEK